MGTRPEAERDALADCVEEVRSALAGAWITPARLSRPAAAEVRRTIVRSLGPDNEMTIAELKEAVTLRLPTAQRAAIGEQIRVLRDDDYIEVADGGSRWLALTESGRRWYEGIEALAPGGPALEKAEVSRAAGGAETPPCEPDAAPEAAQAQAAALFAALSEMSRREKERTRARLKSAAERDDPGAFAALAAFDEADEVAAQASAQEGQTPRAGRAG